MNRHPRYRTAIVLCLSSACLLSSNGHLRSQEAGSLNPVAQQALPSLIMTLERPLFAPSRRKPEGPAPVVIVETAPTPPPAPPSVVLVGIMENNHDKFAVLRSGSEERTMRVRVGDDVSGWKIAEIASRGVTFSLDDRTSSVSLFQGLSAKPGAGIGRAGRGQLDNDALRGE